MDLEWLSPLHQVHINAVFQAGVQPRLVMLFPRDGNGPPRRVVGTLVCPRSRKCGTCAWELGDKARVHVGLVQRQSPVEVEGIRLGEPATPTATHGLPEEASP